MPALKPGHVFVTPEEDAAITAAAMSDPDALPVTDEEWEAARPFMRIGARPVGRPPAENPKQSTTIRLDADVMGAFKALGRGWQTRINAVLREAVAAGRV